METNDTAVATDTSPEEEEKPIDLAAGKEIIGQIPDTPNNRRYLIPTLQKIQDAYRFLPDPVIKLLMARLRVSRAEIYGIISFYPQLMITEPGKYIIKLCYGTACFVKGAEIIANKIHEKYHIRAGETDKGKLFTMQTASCLGNCGAAPMAIIGEDTHGTIDPEQTLSMLGGYKLEEDAPAAEAEEIKSE
jgi:NADH:ubiquinone oxidoreductase subunit E